MSPGKKTPPARPPVRAKSALPAPRVARKRVHIPWYRQRGVQITGGIVVLVLLFFAVKFGLKFWHHHTTTQHYKTAAKEFDGRFRAAITPLTNVFNQESTTPSSFLLGSVSQTAYVSQTAEWLSAFRSFSSQAQAAKPPPPMQKARAEMVQAADVFIDAVKDFQVAGTTTDGKARTTLIQQASSTWSHGVAVLETALQDEAIVLHNYALPLPSQVSPSSLSSPPPMPPEVYNPGPSSGP